MWLSVQYVAYYHQVDNIEHVVVLVVWVFPRAWWVGGKGREPCGFVSRAVPACWILCAVCAVCAVLQEGFPDLRFPIYIKNIHKCKQ